MKLIKSNADVIEADWIGGAEKNFVVVLLI